MTDIFDRAQELEQRQRDAALAAQAARSHRGISLSHCKDCGEAIPEARRVAVPGCSRCFDCQTIAE
ncbi:TraR/DksA family transcriptional regulator [Paludibacterium paludis]|uniref:Repressor PtrB n=1 Tax=Paludibacterium paludis TaxID=1225769 RepID=A0A918U7M5_9NEIS|nr:TraR/DksA family transcriptional regulator [Paludibacterium paludis]GGY03835.1 repressor PtrB [Paludibacterium paludis]